MEKKREKPRERAEPRVWVEIELETKDFAAVLKFNEAHQ